VPPADTARVRITVSGLDRVSPWAGLARTILNRTELGLVPLVSGPAMPGPGRPGTGR
jgi:hypothetical protein